MYRVEHDSRRLGFVGLGKMGTPMVARLIGRGWRVIGFDADATSGADLAGAPGFERALELTEVAAGSALVFLMLPDSNAVESVLYDGGLLNAIGPDTVLLDMGSSEPTRTRELAGRARECGVSMLDAPVSGGVSGARTGTLTVMVGGSTAALRTARSALDTLGSSVVHVGEAGAGHALKALNNLMSATHLLATSEAMIVARSFGLDPESALEVVNSSSGRSGSTEEKWPRFVLTERFDSGFALGLMVKDLRIALGLAESVQSPTRLGHAVAAMWSEAAAELPTDSDHTEIVRWLQGRIRTEGGSESR